MMVDYEQVKEDFARKDARIAELEKEGRRSNECHEAALERLEGRVERMLAILSKVSTHLGEDEFIKIVSWDEIYAA